MNTTIEDVKQYFDQFGKVSRLCVKQLKALWDVVLISLREAACYSDSAMGK